MSQPGGGMNALLRSWAAALGGEIVGDSVLCPGPGRPPDDRSLLVTPPGFTADGTEAEVANARDRRTAKRLGLIKVRP
jgi:hypothetical protein